ncbi:MAG: tetraacyldisaccharide 4'-kinase [Thermodesulfobacteriota bacterium]|nr:tetraacyldisaccharide 4'-kinase [Thermodesulfobacteriota bacterium]
MFLKKANKFYKKILNNGKQDFYLIPFKIIFYLFSLFFLFGIKIRSFLYNNGILTTRKLNCKVVSIGNLSMGGTGKTPLTIFLAGLFINEKKKVAVLSRGYKGKKLKKSKIVRDEREFFLNPVEAGDEPYLMAKQIKAPVIIGKNRYLSGKLAIKKYSTEIIILDDGFQHLGLFRNLDIVIINALDYPGRENLFPLGYFREPFSHIKRADLILIGKSSNQNVTTGLEEKIRKYKNDVKLFFMDLYPEKIIDISGEKNLPLAFLRDKEVAAISAIAHPEHFFLIIKDLGAKIVKKYIYPDHHIFTMNDIKKWEREKIDDIYIILTEKDAVKLPRVIEDKFKFIVLSVKVRIEPLKEFVDIIRQKILG